MVIYSSSIGECGPPIRILEEKNSKLEVLHGMKEGTALSWKGIGLHSCKGILVGGSLESVVLLKTKRRPAGQWPRFCKRGWLLPKGPTTIYRRDMGRVHREW
jgi:hypothetical protein